ncbi:hypothetical protein GH714_011315 [Hevea brasiliensis]|uniref:Cation/H(+) antiporter C-terminal domain-containing protein n=1 Tax=Hevea brasiliensis TaxID=3981 RepID=A0A6A6KJV3_HEVBR|nr:hypothetical protein GH714_011315 [Hevea brasiliensis]
MWVMDGEGLIRGYKASALYGGPFVDRGFGNVAQTPGPSTVVAQKICVIFFGGPDDREELDEKALAEFRSKCDGMVVYIEKVTGNIVEGVLAIGRSRDYDLIIVGKGRFPSTMVAELADRQAEHAELGPIGDILASSRHDVVPSVLVIQQHDLDHVEEALVSKVLHTRYEKFKAEDKSLGLGEISNVV